MKKVDMCEIVINQDIRSTASELEKEIEDKLARLPIPPCVPPDIVDMMRGCAPMLAYYLALTMKGAGAKWN
jgi:hypothetical protein